MRGVLDVRVHSLRVAEVAHDASSPVAAEEEIVGFRRLQFLEHKWKKG